MPVSRRTPGSDVPENDHGLQTENAPFGGNGPFGGRASFAGNGAGRGTGPLGTGTLAFEPGFTLDSQYTGETPQFAEGSQFGVYVVGPCIGEGGMARVYRAEHAGLKRQVALKVMTQGFARDSEGRERFLREARIAAAIKHPNVVNIFDVGVCQGIPYLVMELLEGEDLEKVLLAKGMLDESTIIDLVVPVVAGLVAVHDAGIVHRDLKPGNIFLARGRNDEIEPKLLDFGISKASGKDHLKLTAANGALMGTPFYMAPEAVQGAEMTPLSDQYALGVVLRECATGKNPFEGNNFAEVVALIANARYSSLGESTPRLSKRFVAIIERAMSLDPRNRFEDMRAMGRQLLMLAGQRTRITWGLTFGPEGRGSLALASTFERRTVETPALPPAPPRRRKRATAMLIAGVALLSAGVTMIVLSERDGDAQAVHASAPVAAPARGEVTLVMPSTPNDDRPLTGAMSDREFAVTREQPAPSPRPSNTDTAGDTSDEVSARNVEDAEERREVVKKRPAAAVRKPSRPPPRQSAPKPVPAQANDDEEWEITVSSKPPATSNKFEVGSNNAPILD